MGHNRAGVLRKIKMRKTKQEDNRIFINRQKMPFKHPGEKEDAGKSAKKRYQHLVRRYKEFHEKDEAKFQVLVEFYRGPLQEPHCPQNATGGGMIRYEVAMEKWRRKMTDRGHKV